MVRFIQLSTVLQKWSPEFQMSWYLSRSQIKITGSDLFTPKIEITENDLNILGKDQWSSNSLLSLKTCVRTPTLQKTYVTKQRGKWLTGAGWCNFTNTYTCLKRVVSPAPEWNKKGNPRADQQSNPLPEALKFVQTGLGCISWTIFCRLRFGCFHHCCLGDLPLLPDYHLPKKNGADKAISSWETNET